MQTFSFADSKLGYLTAAKGALVVRVKSCRATPHHGTVTVSPLKTLAAAAAAGAGNNDLKTTACDHIADETGNFTLVQRRSLAYRMHYLSTAMVVSRLLTIKLLNSRIMLETMQSYRQIDTRTKSRKYRHCISINLHI